MISRARRLVSRIRQAPTRIDQIERHLAEVSAHLAAIDRRGGLHERALADVPDFFLAAERTITERLLAEVDVSAQATLDAAVAASTATGAAARRHAEDAVASVHQAAVTAARQHTEAAMQDVLETSRSHAEQLGQQVREAMSVELARIRRELVTLKRSGVAAPTAPSSVQGVTSGAVEVDPAFYVALEDRFRGESSVIQVRQKAYLEIVADCSGSDAPVIDLGFGRGEWLTVLRDAGIKATGVDMNAAFVAEARDLGHEVVHGDIVEYLHAAADGSAGAITMFQVVEHLPLPVLLDVLAEAVRVLRPGGVFIAETPNALNLRVAASTFWIDPTHQRPLHPEFLRFCAEQAGFATAEGLFLNELQPGYESIADPAVRRLLEMVDGPGDYTLVART